jgi:predicted tellurium resistance membrane protein TerC
MMHFLAFFITTAVLVMFLGSRQQRMTDRYGIAAMVIFALLAIASTAMLHGTVFFAAAAFAIALLVAVHHVIASFGSDDAPERCTLFQGRPASSFHELCITAAAVAGVVSMLRL